MSENVSVSPAPSGYRLGVLEAMGLGWGLLKSDFWTLWLVTFLAMAIQGFSGPAAIVVAPPMVAACHLSESVLDAPGSSQASSAAGTRCL